MVNYIIITGGVISGLGKGITTACIGKILQLHGYKVTAMKIDPYMNCDAGTLRPTEHGEVWVTEDGGEIDQDLGHYERFLDINIPKYHNITTGQVYGAVIDKERKGKYLGKTVQPIPHVTNEIKDRIRRPSKDGNWDFVLVEIGGTVGDYENVLFLEAVRQMKMEGDSVLYVHVTYVPVLDTLGEAKTKPTQHSVKLLREIGIQPDFIITRSEDPLDNVRREKIAMFCNVHEEEVISDSNIDNVYAVTLLFEKQELCKKVLKKLNLRKDHNDLVRWERFIKKIRKLKTSVKIGIVGKYFDIGTSQLSDSYISVIEAVKHAAWNNNLKPDICWIDSKVFEKDPKKLSTLNKLDGIIVPGGFGLSGISGKIDTIRYAREHEIPYLGLCLGMQLAVVEYAQNKCKIAGANTVEVEKKPKHPVIDFIPEQVKIIQESRYGATMRLGAWPALLKKGSLVQKLYGANKVYERHRHRYEVNPKYIEQLEKCGLIFSGRSPDGVLMEFMELSNHPYFVATQAHPEFKSRPMKPSPLFDGLIKAAKKEGNYYQFNENYINFDKHSINSGEEVTMNPINNVLNLKARREIYDFILKNPGLHIREISRQMNIPKTTLTYHLKYLIKEEIVIEKFEGGFKRIYIKEELGSQDKEIINLLRQDIPSKIFIYFIFSIAPSQIEISKALELHPATVSYHLKKLEGKGVIEKAPVSDNGIAPFPNPKNPTFINQKPIGREIFYRRKNQQIINDAYRVLITHKDSLPNKELIDTYIDYLGLMQDYKKGWKLDPKKRVSVNDQFDNIMNYVLELFKPPFCS